MNRRNLFKTVAMATAAVGIGSITLNLLPECRYKLRVEVEESPGVWIHRPRGFIEVKKGEHWRSIATEESGLPVGESYIFQMGVALENGERGINPLGETYGQLYSEFEDFDPHPLPQDDPNYTPNG